MQGEIYSGDDERQQLNKAGEESVLAQAEKTRTELIDFAFKAVQYYIQEDREGIGRLEENDEPASQVTSVYVLEDVISAPATDDRIPRTLTLLLVPNIELGQQGEERLRILVPIADDQEARALERANEVYFEITHEDKSVRRYAINDQGIYEYISAVDAGEQVIMDDLHESVWSRKAALRVDTGLPIITQIQQDVINKRAIPQRMVYAGDTEAHTFDY